MREAVTPPSAPLDLAPVRFIGRDQLPLIARAELLVRFGELDAGDGVAVARSTLISSLIRSVSTSGLEGRSRIRDVPAGIVGEAHGSVLQKVWHDQLVTCVITGLVPVISMRTR
jgi:hypothetical protein